MSSHHRSMMQRFILIFHHTCGFTSSFITLFWNLAAPLPFLIVLCHLRLLSNLLTTSYEVAIILVSKIIRYKLNYLVDWVVYPPSDRTWELVANVGNAQALADDFYRNYPNKLGPTFLMLTSTPRSRRGDSVMRTGTQWLHLDLNPGPCNT